MIAVIATLHCQEDNLEHLESALKTLQFHSRQENGCQRYDLLRRTDGDKIELVVNELWDNTEALDAHFNAGHFRRFSEQATEIVESSEIRKYRIIED